MSHVSTYCNHHTERSKTVILAPGTVHLVGVNMGPARDLEKITRAVCDSKGSLVHLGHRLHDERIRGFVEVGAMVIGSGCSL